MNNKETQGKKKPKKNSQKLEKTKPENGGARLFHSDSNTWAEVRLPLVCWRSACAESLRSPCGGRAADLFNHAEGSRGLHPPTHPPTHPIEEPTHLVNIWEWGGTLGINGTPNECVLAHRNGMEN